MQQEHRCTQLREHPPIAALPRRANDLSRGRTLSLGFDLATSDLEYADRLQFFTVQPGSSTDSAPHAQEAFYSSDLGEFILPYDVIGRSASPDDTLLNFVQTAYEAAATLGHCTMPKKMTSGSVPSKGM